MWRPLFADDTSVTTVMAVAFGAIATLATALSAAYALVIKARAQAKKDEIDGWRALVESHVEQGERQERNMQSMMVVLEMEQRHHMQCQRVATQLKSALYFMQDAYNRMHSAVVSLGGDPGAKLELPNLDNIDADTAERADFLTRQIQQNVIAVKAADKQLASQKAALESTSGGSTNAGAPPGK